MSRDNDEAKIDRHLETGYEALEMGDLATAKKSAKATIAIDATVAEAHTLLGAVAEREDDLPGAISAYTAARKADPASFDPVIALAELEHAQGNIDKARALFGEASDLAEEEEEFVESLLARAEFELAEGDGHAAVTVLTELPPVDLPEPNDHLRAGDALRQAAALIEGAEGKQALADAQKHFESARAQVKPGEDDALTADAVYGLGLVAEARGLKEEVDKCFSEVLRLDIKEGKPSWTLSEERMEALVEEVLGELPERARELLSNVPIVVESRPTRSQVHEGLDPRSLGLFAGPPTQAAGDAPVLQQITLYTRNLERASASVEDLEDEIRVTLLHETGHFFGLDESAMAELGLE